MPEEAVITDEAVTYGRGFFPFTYAAPPHDWLNSTGGAIGCGPPLAGAAVSWPGQLFRDLEFPHGPGVPARLDPPRGIGMKPFSGSHETMRKQTKGTSGTNELASKTPRRLP